ncbi:MAG: serine/threonine-protein kinase [bacterium]
MEKPEITATRIAHLALARKLISKNDLIKCQNLVNKSRKIGLETNLPEILVKQSYLTQEQVDELNEFGDLDECLGVFGNYRLEAVLGEGGMGKVYRARQNFLNRTVAIKVLNSKSFNNKTRIERFCQEIRALGKLKHTNIVTIFDAGKLNSNYYFSMEFVPGPTLKDHLDKSKHLPEDEAKLIILPIAKGLAHAHKYNVVHRDIKPENILIDHDGTPKLTDFGVVMHRDVDHLTLTQEGMMVGSPYYVSPEQAEGRRDIDHRSDIYSLGATFYHTIAGRPVFDGETPPEIMSKHITEKWISPRKANSKISFRTAGIIKKMMAKKREKRFQNMDEVISALEGNKLKRRLLIILISSVSLIIICGFLELERNFNVWSKIIAYIF